MTQYLVAIHHPDDYDAATEGEAMQRDIRALNTEMPGSLPSSAASRRYAKRCRCG